MEWLKKKLNELLFEKRQFERLKPEEDFFVEFQQNGFKNMRLGQGKDISLGGLRFATSALLKKGEELEMLLYFPKKFQGSRKVQTRVKVKRVNHPGPSHRLRVACEFVPPSAEAQEAIASYLEWAKTWAQTESLTPAG